MTDSAKYVLEALRDVALVKTEEALLGWHDLYMNTVEYLALSEDEARQLERAYQKKAGWFMGVGAG